MRGASDERGGKEPSRAGRTSPRPRSRAARPAPTQPSAALPGDTATSLDGFLSTSPTPPPLRSPWLSTVTMHMSSVSHVCSWSCSVSSAGGSSVNTAREQT